MVERSTYKGNPVLSLKETAESKFAFSFGETKARLILAHIKEIETFVADCEAQKKGQ